MIIDGKTAAAKLLSNLKEEISTLDKKPCLAVILAGDDPASRVYVSQKEKKCASVGIKSSIYTFDKSVKQNDIIKLINELNKDPLINGILVQLPLYEHLIEAQILETIEPSKDVDGFHPINVGKLTSGLEPYAIPCTPFGIMKLFEEYNIDPKGKNALVIGRSNIVGKPMAALLLKADATVTIAHSKTQNLSKIAKKADIIISAAGREKIVGADMVKDGAIVIDVGIIRKPDKSLCGDVDFEKVKDIASYITPVPGGVGPMTIACLMENTYRLYKLQKGIE